MNNKYKFIDAILLGFMFPFALVIISLLENFGFVGIKIYLIVASCCSLAILIHNFALDETLIYKNNSGIV